MSKEDKIKELLLVDDNAVWEETIVLASKLISITKSGEIIYKIPEDKLTFKEKILLLAIGRRYAFEAKLIDQSFITIDEISNTIRSDKKNISARLAELRNEKKIKDVDRGKYDLNIYDLKKFLIELIKKYE